MISQRQETERGVCRFCRGLLPRFGYHWTCHVCGEAYCYIHLQRHPKHSTPD